MSATVNEKKIPKTGMAGRMREWMKGRKRPFAPKDIAAGLGLPFGKERDNLRNSMPDFIGRGEVLRMGDGKYIYNRDWKPKRIAALENMVLKAVYLSGQAFTIADVLRDIEADRSYVARILRMLVEEGYILKVGERPVRQGKEQVFKLMDRARFRVEVMD